MEPLAMETVAGQERTARSRRDTRCFAFCVLPLALCLAGCVGTSSFVYLGGEALNRPPCQLVATWNPGVVNTPDPTHDGAETPGLVGRIYLFGSEIGAPLTGDGSLVVQLYDDTASPVAKDARPLEEWQFDPETLKRLQRRDAIGWGYTLFLPWGTYKPEIGRVHLKVRYTPSKGGPLYTAGSPMTLGDPEKMKKLAAGLAHGISKNEAVQRQGLAESAASVQGIRTVAGQQPRP